MSTLRLSRWPLLRQIRHAYSTLQTLATKGMSAPRGKTLRPCTAHVVPDMGSITLWQQQQAGMRWADGRPALHAARWQPLARPSGLCTHCAYTVHTALHSTHCTKAMYLLKQAHQQARSWHQSQHAALTHTATGLTSTSLTVQTTTPPFHQHLTSLQHPRPTHPPHPPHPQPPQP